MVSYASMSDAELEEYRKKSRKETKEREENWKKKHPNGIDPSYRTPFDDWHHIPYPIR